ncbi:hypothetical protein BDZ97DRAFT_402832 [Flammula alnicola]|nr:hypothetical protein BDZ97DRAFT_402832 [Flammula alnicola]
MGGGDSPTPRLNAGEKDELSTQFNKSIGLVRDYTSRLEHDYAQPAFVVSRGFFEERPISATFIAIFSLLSSFPVFTFLGVSLFIIVTFITIALGVAFIAAAGVVLGLLTILLSILTAAFFTSMFLTLVSVSCYLFLRLVVLVRQEGKSGFFDWAGEMKRYILNTTGRGRQNDSNFRVPEDRPSDSTNAYSGIVQEEDNRPPDFPADSPYSDYDVKVQGG